MKNIIEIKGLAKSFGKVRAVDGISFSVCEGELFAFLGVNGAGKSTTINIMCGMLSPDSGSVSIDGCTLSDGGEKIKRGESVFIPANEGEIELLGEMEILAVSV